jgi:hypothetical protein
MVISSANGQVLWKYTVVETVPSAQDQLKHPDVPVCFASGTTTLAGDAAMAAPEPTTTIAAVAATTAAAPNTLRITNPPITGSEKAKALCLVWTISGNAGDTQHL